MRKIKFVLAFVCLIAWLGAAEAQYVLELKNGRQITVQSYREEGSMIKFSGLGGEIGISKAQVQAIRRAGQADRTRATSLAVDQLSPARAPQQSEATTKPADSKPAAPPVAPAETPGAKRAAEEKVYQQKVKELTAQLQELREQYAARTRGNTGSEPQFFTTEEAFRGHQEDLLSRLRDAQFRAQGLPSGSNATSPPFSLNPPPAYSEKQKELSDLRSQMNQVENERQRIIEEMKAKNFDTGSLFLD
ncbi:MAG: hypothetical protein ACREQ2_20050 [Candidatus Binatia bacterium]